MWGFLKVLIFRLPWHTYMLKIFGFERFSFLFSPFTSFFKQRPSLFSLSFAPQKGYRKAEFPTVKGTLPNCFLIISRACCETASAGPPAGPQLGSVPGAHFRAHWVCSVICHCKGQRKWLFLSERIKFHPTITSLLCLQIFSQRKKALPHMWCRISAFL